MATADKGEQKSPVRRTGINKQQQSTMSHKKSDSTFNEVLVSNACNQEETSSKTNYRNS
jgi:hypothetical protein